MNKDRYVLPKRITISTSPGHEDVYVDGFRLGLYTAATPYRVEVEHGLYQVHLVLLADSVEFTSGVPKDIGSVSQALRKVVDYSDSDAGVHDEKSRTAAELLEAAANAWRDVAETARGGRDA